MAVRAKESLRHLEITFGERILIDEAIRKKMELLPPPLKRNYLTSPPPSPPLGWKPIGESINTIPFFDLDATFEGEVQILLTPNDGKPKITVENFEKDSFWL
eukprot:TRINITY_DN10120_c0_g1_i1.p1 TRINITY_DN10120_c0_g1~~TRINITY_DN10120_c0_g1_i1.p1  ORF type:complete len:102 (+),score=20.89 TRINITY_DN10120_c0_g1_i1:190-495(+)